MAGVRLEKLVKRYGNVETLHGIDLDIKHNEFVVLVGPSGCGKSTTLRMIAGLEEVSGGEVYIGDDEVGQLPPRDRDVAMVFQNYALYPHMNVYDNMSFSLKLKKTPKAEINKLVMDAAEILGLNPLLKRKPSELSGGQRQRVAMGRAIVRHPSVFLFDEPLSNLDAKLRNQMRTEIKKLHRKVQTTIIYVTHDQVEAMTLADRIVVLKDGYIEQIGTPMDIYENPANTFVAQFIGNPPMNLVSANVEQSGSQKILKIGDQYQFTLPEDKTKNLSKTGEVILGVRPNDIVVGSELKKIPEDWQFEASVSVVEPLGAESVIFIELPNGEVTAQVPGREAPEVLSMAKFGIDLKHLHLFDPQSTRSLL